MIILCTHNDGGVGKTTLAVHTAGIFLALSETTLLVDCDDQADFWKFYTGREPIKSQDVHIEGYRTIISNKERKPIKSLTLKGYDNVVLDIDSPLQNTVQVIVGNNPDLILVPVNKSQRTKSLNNLPRTLSVISKLSKPGFFPQVIIVPLGVPRNLVTQVVDKINIENKPQNCKVAEEMPDLQEEMQLAIYEDKKYIWEYENYRNLQKYFYNLVKI
ncbi:nucleotide-binding protein [Nostoc sp. UHCC 0870]|uniref:nucleotide-binding protein n=1 Tax=Nostoc sp. UHCC 0870 TaxID=2914041 RepID=UPI001EE01F8E|nr:AAA family ATPase [Nostoc sp. UHCC 0870]UKO97831.1 AAA family ATPase [Nostoc sp. UHCC 0870]